MNINKIHWEYCSWNWWVCQTCFAGRSVLDIFLCHFLTHVHTDMNVAVQATKVNGYRDSIRWATCIPILHLVNKKSAMNNEWWTQTNTCIVLTTFTFRANWYIHHISSDRRVITVTDRVLVSWRERERERKRERERERENNWVRVAQWLEEERNRPDLERERVETETEQIKI